MEQTDACAQNCTDTEGSYNCSCIPGYSLANNNYGCNGKYYITLSKSCINVRIAVTLKILMNALTILTTASRLVRTLLDHSTVVVIQDIG